MSHTYIRPPGTPSLPYAPRDWTPVYQDQYSRVLRLYFNQLSNIFQQLAAPQGGFQLSFPYGAFQDSTTQTATVITNAYVMTFNTTDLSNGISVVGGSKITVEKTGVYDLQFSAQLANDTPAAQDIDIWFRKNGNDIPNSTSRFGLAPRKSAGDPYHTIGTLNYFVSLDGGDYVELVWCTTNIAANITSYPAGTAPTRPAIPSVIVTATFVSAPLE